MPEPGSPPPLDKHSKAPSQEELEGAFLWFDGILEGPVGDRDLLRSTATRLDAIGVVNAHLEIEGPRFSILLDDRSKRMSQVTDQQRGRFLELVQTIVDMSPDPMSVESTLRCTEVIGQEARETLFAISAAEVKRVSRARRANNDDLNRRPRQTSMMGRKFEESKWRKPAVISLVLLAGVAFAFQSGLVGQIFSPPAEELALDNELFGPLLDVEVEKKLGTYIVSISRGEDFPLTMAEFEARAKAEKLLEKAAVLGAISRGESIYVGLKDDEDNVWFEKGISLKPLLLKADNTVAVPIPGRADAKAITLALSPLSVHK